MTNRPPFAAKLAISILAIEILGGLGAFFTSQSIPGWYAQLEKPPGTPPNWLFGPVWVSLYAMIGITFAILWQRGFQSGAKRVALYLFVLQMVFNLAWTPLFFGLHQILIALVVIVFLWLAILATIVASRKISKVAAVLLIPYLLWVGYATYLNAGYWYLNR